jgi:hypothetical protein
MTDPLDVEEAKREVLEGIAARMAEIIECTSYGAIMTEDEATYRYYLVQWTSKPYTLLEEMDELHGRQKPSISPFTQLWP